jgi:hypothetical protein
MAASVRSAALRFSFLLTEPTERYAQTGGGSSSSSTAKASSDAEADAEADASDRASSANSSTHATTAREQRTVGLFLVRKLVRKRFRFFAGGVVDRRVRKRLVSFSFRLRLRRVLRPSRISRRLERRPVAAIVAALSAAAVKARGELGGPREKPRERQRVAAHARGRATSLVQRRRRRLWERPIGRGALVGPAAAAYRMRV